MKFLKFNKMSEFIAQIEQSPCFVWGRGSMLKISLVNNGIEIENTNTGNREMFNINTNLVSGIIKNHPEISTTPFEDTDYPAIGWNDNSPFVRHAGRYDRNTGCLIDPSTDKKIKYDNIDRIAESFISDINIDNTSPLFGFLYGRIKNVNFTLFPINDTRRLREFIKNGPGELFFNDECENLYCIIEHPRNLNEFQLHVIHRIDRMWIDSNATYISVQSFSSIDYLENSFGDNIEFFTMDACFLL